MKNLKEVSRLVKRLVLFFIGMSIIQFGVAVFLQTSIGSDPFTIIFLQLSVLTILFYLSVQLLFYITLPILSKPYFNLIINNKVRYSST